MRQDYIQEYTSPVLESIDLEVEKGFATSGYSEAGCTPSFNMETDVTDFGEY